MHIIDVDCFHVGVGIGAIWVWVCNTWAKVFGGMVRIGCTSLCLFVGFMGCGSCI